MVTIEPLPYRYITLLTRPYPDAFMQVDHENLSIAYITYPSTFNYRVYSRFNERLIYGYLDPDFLQQIPGLFPASINLCPALLPAARLLNCPPDVPLK